MLDRKAWTGGCLVLAVVLVACRKGEPSPQAQERPSSETPASAAPASPPFVPAPLPPTSFPIYGKQWKRVTPAEQGVVGVALLVNGTGQVSQLFPGKQFPTGTMADWTRTANGVRLTLKVGKTPPVYELRYGTVDGQPRLLWDGKTRGLTGVPDEGEVAFHLPDFKPPAGPSESERIAAYQNAPAPPEGSPFTPKTVWCHEGEGGFLHLGEGHLCLRVDKLIDEDGEATHPEERCWWQAGANGLKVLYGPQKTELLNGTSEHTYTFKQENGRTNLYLRGEVALQDCTFAEWKAPRR